MMESSHNHRRLQPIVGRQLQRPLATLPALQAWRQCPHVPKRQMPQRQEVQGRSPQPSMHPQLPPPQPLQPLLSLILLRPPLLLCPSQSPSPPHAMTLGPGTGPTVPHRPSQWLYPHQQHITRPSMPRPWPPRPWRHGLRPRSCRLPSQLPPSPLLQLSSQKQVEPQLPQPSQLPCTGQEQLLMGPQLVPQLHPTPRWPLACTILPCMGCHLATQPLRPNLPLRWRLTIWAVRWRSSRLSCNTSPSSLAAIVQGTMRIMVRRPHCRRSRRPVSASAARLPTRIKWPRRRRS
mmetsp:Transcript_67560/g.119855  ORF Transcript_67560/g.119855 Transcript_67560/m.119855 type:complete len:291 (+) Transcript_67560:451-1323(+)